VQAAAVPESSMVNLFVHPRYSLMLGLGLVNFLNLSQFKAVLAHEFGHFTQKSGRTDRYVFTALGVIDAVTHGPDAFDRLLDGVRRSGSLGFLAAPPQGIIWCLRKFLAGAFWGLLYSFKSLRRQKEFHADLVAVTAAGSDAIIHGLYRSVFADMALGQAVTDLRTAAEHGLYTADLFHHQNHAAAFLRKIKNEPELGEIPPPPEGAGPADAPRLFKPSDVDQPSMWADHPPLYERELNAREQFVEAIPDDRSPWLLVHDAPTLREKVTWRFYRVGLKLPKDTLITEADVVQKFIDDEHADTTFDPKYGGAYDERPVRPGELADVEAALKLEPWPAERIARAQARLHDAELGEHVEAFRSLQKEMRKVREYASERPKRDLLFRGKRYRGRRQIDKLTRSLERELDEVFEWLASYDRRVALVHFQMAHACGGRALRELANRYEFQVRQQDLYFGLLKHQGQVLGAWAMLTGQNSARVSPGLFRAARETLVEAHEALKKVIRTAEDMTLPALRNLKEGSNLADYLLDEPVLRRPARDSISGHWVIRFLRQSERVLDKLRRLHFKSVSGLLDVQERIAKRWTELNVPAVEVVDDAPAPATPKTTPAPSAALKPLSSAVRKPPKE
jgi:Zn-dependent protease with chaperone function